MPVAAGNLSGHTPAVYLPVAGAGIKKARDDLPGLWSTDRSGTIDQEGGGVKDNATFSLSHSLCICVDTEIGRKHRFQKEDSEIGNGLLTVEAPCPSQSPQDHVR